MTGLRSTLLPEETSPPKLDAFFSGVCLPRGAYGPPADLGKMQALCKGVLILHF